MNETKRYQIIRSQVLKRLGYPPLNRQVQRYGEMTPEEIVNEVAIPVLKASKDEWDYGLIRHVTNLRLIDLYRVRQAYSAVSFSLMEEDGDGYNEDHKDEYRDLLSSTSSLTMAQREILLLLCEGHGHEDIGTYLSITPKASRKRLERLRVTLKKEMEISQ
jgi:DNA-directed RNA polymerase specialized sigma24 family protein